HAPANNLCRSGKRELVGPHRGLSNPHPERLPSNLPALHPSPHKVSRQPLNGTSRFMISA
ncbi:hypothetical protein EMPG_17741, partial [Blastomyces silverae]